MTTVRSSFTPHGQNFKIPKIDFCDVITSALYYYIFPLIPTDDGYSKGVKCLGQVMVCLHRLRHDVPLNRISRIALELRNKNQQLCLRSSPYSSLSLAFALSIIKVN